MLSLEVSENLPHCLVNRYWKGNGEFVGTQTVPRQQLTDGLGILPPQQTSVCRSLQLDDKA